MENIKYTTKYLKAIKISFIVAAFTLASPLVVSAQYDSGNNTQIIDGSNYWSDGGNGFQFVDGSNSNSQTQIVDGSNSWSDSGNSFQFVDGSNFNSQTQIVDGTNYNFQGSNNFTVVDGTNFYSDTSNSFQIVDGSNFISQAQIVDGSNFNSSENPVYASLYTSAPWTGGSYYGYGGGNRFVSSGGYTGSGSTFTQGTYTIPPTNSVSSGGYDGSNGSFAYYPSQNYPIYYGSGGYGGVNLNSQFVPNQVLAYTDTNPSLDSVYLSDIPATGFSDYYEILIFISLLVSWSAILAYVFLKKKIESQTIPAVAHANKTEVSNTDSFVTSNLLNKINSDNSEINMVEEYARTNKVLLSSDASIKIVKLSRLGQINASEYIRSIARGEWIAIGANQIV